MHTDTLPAPIRWALQKRRDGRFRAMLRGVTTWPGMSVLDVGCGTDGRSFSDQADASWRITGVDLHAPEKVKHRHAGFTYQQRSAADLSAFADKSFDLVVSVGMLEHIVNETDYRNVCAEIQRVGKQYVVLVPYKWAWIEPHYAFPFFGALPKKTQIGMIKMFNLSGHRHRIPYFIQNFRWRSNAEYLRDFPGARIRFMPTLETITIRHTL